MDKIKTIAVKGNIHAQISQCASDRGMTIQGLTERIFRGWLDENFFDRNIANGNKRRAKRISEVRP